MTEKNLYERLGGVFAIAAVIDHFQRCSGAERGRREDFEESSPKRLAHEEPGEVARAQVHANPVGVRGRGRTVPLHADKTGGRRNSALRKRIAPS